MTSGEIVPFDRSVSRVSVILATRNRATLLHDTLAGLARQQPLAVPHEVVVVDNGSVDDTPAVLARARASSPVPVHAAVEPRPGKSHAINRAIGMASGDFLVFTDDDIAPDDDWLAQLVAGASRWPDVNIFGGRISLSLPEAAPSWLSELKGLALQHYAPAASEGIVAMAPYGPNFAVRRPLIEQRRFVHDVGPDGSPDYAMGHETEFLHRLRDQGERFVYLPAAHVAHRITASAITMPALCNRAYRAGRGSVRVSRSFDGPVPRLFGAPRHLWRSAAEAALARLGVWRDPVHRVQSAIDFAFYRGAIRESRLDGKRPQR